MDKILTISIAAYNAEKYIRKALDSLLVEKYMDLLEVFIIDDGGTDGTLDIAEEYKKKYPNTFIPVHKENGGYGTTVNYSISNATGKYFKLLDGDDWFDTKDFTAMIELLLCNELDALVTNYCQGPQEGHMMVINAHNQGDGSTIDIRELYPSNRAFGMWAVTYRTEVLRQCGLIMPSHELYTDRYYVTIPFAYVNIVMFSELCVYCYRIGRDGQSMSDESQLTHYEERRKGSIELCEFYASEKKKKNPRSKFLLAKVTEFHVAAASVIRYMPKNSNSLALLKEYEKQVASISTDIINHERHAGKFGVFLMACRHLAYIPYRILPDRILKKHWN